MREYSSRTHTVIRPIFVGITSVIVILFVTGRARAQCDTLKLSTDPFTNATSQHRTEVEPDTFAFGTTIVSAFQVGRFFDGGGSAIGFATSTNGGASWRATVLVSTIQPHTVAGGLRTSPLPSAEVDSAGTVYVVWQDCRFRSGCSANDIVMSKSTSETTWGAVTRVTADGGDHFIPGVGVDRTTSGGSARLAV